MKKIFTLGALATTMLLFSQTVNLSKTTKEMYNSLIDAGVKKGLSKTEATQEALKNEEFNKIYIEDLKKSNKKMSKEGIILSRNFIQLPNHKKVAILPFSTKIESDKKKQSKKENIKKEESAMDMIQDKMYKHFAKNQFNYFVEFQDIDRTNQILRSSGLWNNLSRTPTEEIAKALGVDAVIRGDFGQEVEDRNVAEKAAATYLKITTLGLAGSKANEGTLTLSIADAETGEVLWRKESTDKTTSKNSGKLVEYIMKSINKSFPYSVDLKD